MGADGADLGGLGADDDIRKSGRQLHDRPRYGEAVWNGW
jgi:hypothetical protein